eukprot:TRINITY_DN234_c0_g1_i1.p1 TRINITY_DN234_c0_g1~~TRINITY_DN234_c0_g1_i1.p1  ORF type:complete len:120 (+),score=32.97 TRINITY_DN234_c0_g1_i1:137-496(+)
MSNSQEDDVFVSIFKKLDKNKDGAVSRNELIAALRSNKKAMQTMNLQKGATLDAKSTFSKCFSEMTGPKDTKLTYDNFMSNMSVIHFLLLEQEEEEEKKQAAAKAKTTTTAATTATKKS